MLCLTTAIVAVAQCEVAKLTAGDGAAVAGKAQHAAFQLHDADMPGDRGGQGTVECGLGGEQCAGAHGKAVRQLAGE